jgi:nucleosome assembly protein 1-like 1
VLSNNSLVGSRIFEPDEDALTYLQDIRLTELEGDNEGFTLTFHFAENPYFTNTVLTKTYHMDPDDMLGELQYDHATG